MKKIIWLIPLLFLIGCATTDYSVLESRVTALEKAKAKDIMDSAHQAGARKFWWRNARTGGGASALDGIEGMVDGDACFVMELSGTTATGYLYIFDAGGAQSENDPLVIDGSGTPAGDWLLVNWNADSVTTNAAAGYHYLEVTNAGDLNAGVRAEGRCWYDTDNHLFKCIGDSNAVTTIGP